MAKMYGDVTDQDKQLATALEAAERWLDKSPEEVIAELKAKFYVCWAHDWYEMGMDEEGERLLGKAQCVYPTYFSNKIVQQAKEDPEFAFLITRLQEIIAIDIMLALGVKL